MSNLARRSRRNLPQYTSRMIATFAFGMLIIIGIAVRIAWPISLLGWGLNARTYQIDYVDPDTPADKAGLQVGDRVVTLYGRPVDVFLRSNTFQFIGMPGSSAPIVIQRGNETIDIEVPILPPSIKVQATKLSFLSLALVCWVTGYLLGVVRRHNAHGSPFVSLYWIGMSGIYGSLPLAIFASPPIMRIITWLLPTIFVPLSIYIHVSFPPRPNTSRPMRVAALTFGLSWVALGLIVVWAYATRRSVAQVDALLWVLVPLEIVGALCVVAWMLHHAYKKATVAHTRRQIRLIAIACSSVALLVMLLFVIPRIALGPGWYLIDPNWGIILIGAVPLAYLAGGLTSKRNLYRLDRLASRTFLHLLTMTLIVALLVLLESSLTINGDIVTFLGIVAFVMVYQPVHTFVRRTVQRDFTQGLHPATEAAIRTLMRTLDASTLVQTLVTNVKEQYGQPAFAIYYGDIHGNNSLSLRTHHRMTDLPTTIMPGALIDALTKAQQITDSDALYSDVNPNILTPVEQQLVADPMVALWCPITHSQGFLLGLMLLGYRGDLDPYRPIDLRNLQSLIDAAALAFAHSGALAKQREAEEAIRGLLQRLQSGHDTVARHLALELHDEIINEMILTNVQDLKHLSEQTHDPALRAQLGAMIETQLDLISALRAICEKLYPTGIDDPLGLPGVLRRQVMKVQERWRTGTCQLAVSGSPIPIEPQVQHAALRITKEALANSVKHAGASAIMVHLSYPSTADACVQLTIRDNGRGDAPIVPIPEHWGVLSMQENARAVRGQISFVVVPGEGTSVEFTFPVGHDVQDESQIQLSSTILVALTHMNGRSTS